VGLLTSLDFLSGGGRWRRPAGIAEETDFQLELLGHVFGVLNWDDGYCQ